MIIIATPHPKCHDSILLSRPADARVFATVDIDFFFMPAEHREKKSIVARLHGGETITLEVREAK